jgi:hypothetical protein
MFDILTDEQRLLTIFNNFNAEELSTACDNIKHVITALNQGATTLLANRRTYGALIFEGNISKHPKSKGVLLDNTNKSPELHNILLKKPLLITVINTLCLSEAMLVKANFINCLVINSADEQAELEAELNSFASSNELQSSYKSGDKASNTATQKTKTSLENSASASETQNKNNVSPIRLTQIKQTLTKAVNAPAKSAIKTSEDIRHKLNSLLNKPTPKNIDVTKPCELATKKA